ncbi:hypothetical protein HYDPIDRAFT_187775 [Hydnomerulius pinastri MD-312]|uniref:ZZ-type domain-containing protein n=1 Tax=Hydnomerulius pinastri MD-312 TaxID=994086 RepID=A0A0C9WF09_9AGAM|nr:hypothetical protein HYDPIDRAFT_187775 [Hydnomerulius pinastri MD-312]
METSLGDNSEGEEEREKEIERLLAWTSQADLTYWKSLANEEVRNFPVHSNVYCDSCGITMLGTRITCLSCNAENFRQEIDLCVNCFGTEIVTDKFAHEEGHPSVKLRKVVHNKGNGSFIRFARKASERASDILRLVGEASGGEENGDNPVDDKGEETEGSESEPSANRDEDPVVDKDATVPVESEGDLGGSLKAENNSLDEGDKTDTSNSDSNSSNSSQTGDGTADFFPRPRCVGCDNEIQAPCWYCVTCDTDAFVCDDCDSNDKSTFSSPHELSHPIVRCHGPPNVEPEPLRPAYEKRMAEMDTKIAALNERLAGLEKKLDGSQNGLAEKLAGIEALLSKVLSRLAA